MNNKESKILYVQANDAILNDEIWNNPLIEPVKNESSFLSTLPLTSNAAFLPSYNIDSGVFY